MNTPTFDCSQGAGLDARSRPRGLGPRAASPPADLVKGGSPPEQVEKGGIDDPKGAGAVSSGVALPAIPPVTGNRKSPVASWGKPLPCPILIADRRNNRLIEVDAGQAHRVGIPVARTSRCTAATRT